MYLVSHTTYVMCVNLNMSGGTYSLKPTSIIKRVDFITLAPKLVTLVKSSFQMHLIDDAKFSK